MKVSFARSAVTTSLLLIALLALQRWAPLLPERGAAGWVRISVAQARGRNPVFWDSIWRAGNGYYESLIGDAEAAGSLTNQVVAIYHGQFPWKRLPVRPTVFEFGGIRQWTPKPNLNFQNPGEERTLTNSYGFFDTEHSLEKPPGVRRIALLGDSISQGLGVGQNEAFGKVLESRLNAESPNAEHLSAEHVNAEHLHVEQGERFELLNFAVLGYHMPAIFDVAAEQVPNFHPDVYLVPLTGLTLDPRWGAGLVSAVNRGEDLKYDFLRDLAKTAGLRKGDSDVLADWKLAPYRLAAIRDMLVRMKGRADQQSAQFVVLLVPDAEDHYMLERRFLGLRQSLEGTGIQVVDLLDAFDGLDVESVRIHWYDPHPNALGHRLLADDLLKKLRQDPGVWEAFSGQPDGRRAAANGTEPPTMSAKPPSPLARAVVRQNSARL
jgi:lysophospholipase L1-like esterase